MNRGSLGIRELNARLQNALIPRGPTSRMWKSSAGSSACATKCSQTQNNYDKEVFNGDIGRY